MVTGVCGGYIDNLVDILWLLRGFRPTPPTTVLEEGFVIVRTGVSGRLLPSEKIRNGSVLIPETQPHDSHFSAGSYEWSFVSVLVHCPGSGVRETSVLVVEGQTKWEHLSH